jgi:hypothetical protein
MNRLSHRPTASGRGGEESRRWRVGRTIIKAKAPDPHSWVVGGLRAAKDAVGQHGDEDSPRLPWASPVSFPPKIPHTMILPCPVFDTALPWIVTRHSKTSGYFAHGLETTDEGRVLHSLTRLSLVFAIHLDTRGMHLNDLLILSFVVCGPDRGLSVDILDMVTLDDMPLPSKMLLEQARQTSLPQGRKERGTARLPGQPGSGQFRFSTRVVFFIARSSPVGQSML